MKKKPKIGQHFAPHPSWPSYVPAGSVILGTTGRGKYFWLPPEMRKLGLQIVGLPNQGKSKLMESMISQDILALHGTCAAVVHGDPHGTSAKPLYNKMVTYGIDKIRPIRNLEISDPDF